MLMNKYFQSQRAPRSRASGFTLVELLITMVIASIIFAIAIPSYQSFIQKSRRTDAKSALLDLASLEERYFSVNNVYTNVPTNLGYPGAAPPFNVGSGYYKISQINVAAAVAPTTAAPAGTPASFNIVAVPVAGSPQAGDAACTSFTVASGGVQTSTGTSTTCWQ
jgi:type IV pilus assembly protein PilE